MAVIVAPGISSLIPGTYASASDAYAAAAANMPNGSYNNSWQSTVNGSISNAASQAAQNIMSSQGNQATQLAQMIAGLSQSNGGDYSDYLRQALNIAANNTAQSQSFAREQMDYQRQSDQTAMAWSAQEANKNRLWQESLSNTAHQREVHDLLAAGLNPILAANNGAYTGSGATGQGFSSSGAQGTVDTNASGIMGSMATALINTASQAAITRMYTDASRYQADMQYAASKLASETSIFNENSRNEANKIITQMNNQADIAKANINAGATVSAAGASAAATRYLADQNYAASIYHSDKTLEGTDLSSGRNLEGTQYTSDANARNNRRTNETEMYKATHSKTYDSTKNIIDDLAGAFNSLLGKDSVPLSGGSGRKF